LGSTSSAPSIARSISETDETIESSTDTESENIDETENTDEE